MEHFLSGGGLKEKEACSHMETSPVRKYQFLEAQFYAELQLPFIQCTCGLAKISKARLIVSSATSGRQNKVGVVENVKTISIELHAYTFCELKGFRQSHVRNPISWTDKSVTA